MAIFLQYPEFLLCGFLGIIVMLGSRQPGQLHCPGQLAQPAKSVLLLAPEAYCAWINQKLTYAGWRNNMALGDIAAAKLYTALLVLCLTAFFPAWAVIPAAFVVWFIPDLVLLLLVENRQRQVRQSLPQALDLMVLCVDAGLGLDAALQRISRDDGALTSALNDELNILAREIFLGRDRENSYQDLYMRTGVDELKTLGSALGQASKLGLSIATILRAQSELLRKRQAQKAEESALKMPIYMAFPLWFLIMPALMLLVLGPSLIRFYGTMQGTIQ